MDPSLVGLWGSIMQNQGGSQPAGPYPTFPNAGGFGTQQGYQASQGQGSPFTQPTPQTPGMSMTPQTGAPSSPSQGSFNPWSLQGEAMVRG